MALKIVYCFFQSPCQIISRQLFNKKYKVSQKHSNAMFRCKSWWGKKCILACLVTLQIFLLIFYSIILSRNYIYESYFSIRCPIHMLHKNLFSMDSNFLRYVPNQFILSVMKNVRVPLNSKLFFMYGVFIDDRIKYTGEH